MRMKMNPVCKSKTVSTFFIGKWTIKIVFLLRQKPHRHGQLRRRLRGVSQRMLTRTLRSLESAGLIARNVTKSRYLAVEYSLTNLGKTFFVPLKGICRWANLHRKQLSAVVRLYDTDP